MTSIRVERFNPFKMTKHTAVQVFAGPDAEHRAHCGTLTLRTGEADEMIRRVDAGEGDGHAYLSTACWHELHDGDPDMHASCRASCKWCPTGCSCPGHPDRDGADAPPHWVDQARDIAREFLAAIEDFDRRQVLTPAQWERIRTDPHLFWLRGEEAEPGTWTPPEDRP